MDLYSLIYYLFETITSGKIQAIDSDAEEALEELGNESPTQRNGASPPSSQESPMSSMSGGMLAAQLSQPQSSTPSTSGNLTPGFSSPGLSQVSELLDNADML